MTPSDTSCRPHAVVLLIVAVLAALALVHVTAIHRGQIYGPAHPHSTLEVQ